MNAKEMFEKLGYKQKIKRNDCNNIYLIEYKKEKTGWEHRVSVYQFWIAKKEIKTTNFCNYQSACYCYKHVPKIIPYEQLQAINKQVEELGWNK